MRGAHVRSQTIIARHEVPSTNQLNPFGNSTIKSAKEEIARKIFKIIVLQNRKPIKSN